MSRLCLLALVGYLSICVLGPLRFFTPDSFGRLLGWPIQYGMGFSGAFFSIATLKSRIRRQPRDP